MGDLEAVRLLVENGADAKVITKFFHTALSAPFLNQDNSLEEGRIFYIIGFDYIEMLMISILQIEPIVSYLLRIDGVGNSHVHPSSLYLGRLNTFFH